MRACKLDCNLQGDTLTWPYESKIRFHIIPKWNLINYHVQHCLQSSLYNQQLACLENTESNSQGQARKQIRMTNYAEKSEIVSNPHS